MTSVDSLFLKENTGAPTGYNYIDTTNPKARSVYPNVRVSAGDYSPTEVLPDGTPYNPQPKTMQLTQKFGPKISSSGGCTPITDLLLPETSTMIYTDEFFKQPNANLFLQNIQPNIYSYSVDLTPINSNIGISYTPQIPPKFRDQVYNMPENATYPIYTRIDPQLIRDDGVPARLLEQPIRDNWSADYSNFNPPPGSINFEEIYDPRFASYGDPYRSYSDVNLGQVQYYYSDVDAYRYPNFITRSKVDFIEYTDPMGTVKPYYQREASLGDVRPFVENQWMSDSTYFRENIMESQMQKRNSELWQNRYAPISKAAHTRFGNV